MNPTGQGPNVPGGPYSNGAPSNQPQPHPQYANQPQADVQYPNQQYSNQPYPNQPYPNQHYPNQPQAGLQYPNQPYPNQPYPNQPSAQPSGVPQGAASPRPSAPTDVLGFELVQGERLLMAQRPASSTGGVWFAAMVFSLVLFGLFLVLLGLSGEKGRPRLYALTSMRLVTVDAAGRATSYWFQSYGDVEPIRADVNAGGGGLLGAVVSAAVSAGANALANRNAKLAAGYWTRTVGFLFKDANGATVRVPVGPEAASFALPVAQIVLGRSSDHLRTLELQHVPRPLVGGTGAQVFGVWAVLLSFGFVAYANGMVPLQGGGPPMFLGWPLALVYAGVGVMTFIAGTRLKAAQSALAGPEARAKSTGGAARVFGVLCLLAVPPSLFATYITTDSVRSDARDIEEAKAQIKAAQKRLKHADTDADTKAATEALQSAKATIKWRSEYLATSETKRAVALGALAASLGLGIALTVVGRRARKRAKGG
jgi:hypothetical protein